MIHKVSVSFLLVLLASSWALAQSATDADGVREVLRPPHDSVVDTALVFTNLGGTPALVDVRAFTRNGDPAGMATVRVPGRGLAYVLASGLRAAGHDAILGHAQGVSRSLTVTATAVLVGAGTTDLPVDTRVVVGFLRPVVDAAADATAPTPAEGPARVRHTRITFPVIAAY